MEPKWLSRRDKPGEETGGSNSKMRIGPTKRSVFTSWIEWPFWRLIHVLYRPLFLATALAALVAATVLPAPAAAGTMSKVIELKSKSDDAKRIVAEILKKESDRLDRCGEEYMATKPKGPFLVRLKIRLSPQGAQVLPAKTSDAKYPEVACVGRGLAGVSWPKPSGKIDVVVEILLGRMKKQASKDADLDLDESAADTRNEQAEKQRKAEAKKREQEAKKREQEQREAEAKKREQEAKKREQEQRKAEANGSSVQWRTAQVGYIAKSVEGELSQEDVARTFDELVLPKVAKAWRRARAFNAMVRLKISIGSTGQVQTVDILKSSDADDLQDEVVDAVKEAQWPTSKGGLALEWIFAFKR
jgi:TonB family protein